MHSQADAQVGDPLLACDPAGEGLPLPPARTEAARNEHAVHLLELPARFLEPHPARADPAHAHAAAVVDAAVLERLQHRQVSVLELDVLAHECDLDLALELADAG